ncbi:MAG: hypothetical protein AABX13_03520, partial [Nanoarchaeota archaeon]
TVGVLVVLVLVLIVGALVVAAIDLKVPEKLKDVGVVEGSTVTSTTSGAVFKVVDGKWTKNEGEVTTNDLNYLNSIYWYTDHTTNKKRFTVEAPTVPATPAETSSTGAGAGTGGAEEQKTPQAAAAAPPPAAAGAAATLTTGTAPPITMEQAKKLAEKYGFPPDSVRLTEGKYSVNAGNDNLIISATDGSLTLDRYTPAGSTFLYTAKLDPGGKVTEFSLGSAKNTLGTLSGDYNDEFNKKTVDELHQLGVLSEEQYDEINGGIFGWGAEDMPYVYQQLNLNTDVTKKNWEQLTSEQKSSFDDEDDFAKTKQAYASPAPPATTTATTTAKPPLPDWKKDTQFTNIPGELEIKDGKLELDCGTWCDDEPLKVDTTTGNIIGKVGAEWVRIPDTAILDLPDVQAKRDLLKEQEKVLEDKSTTASAPAGVPQVAPPPPAPATATAPPVPSSSSSAESEEPAFTEVGIGATDSSENTYRTFTSDTSENQVLYVPAGGKNSDVAYSRQGKVIGFVGDDGKIHTHDPESSWIGVDTADVGIISNPHEGKPGIPKFSEYATPPTRVSVGSSAASSIPESFIFEGSRPFSRDSDVVGLISGDKLVAYYKKSESDLSQQPIYDIVGNKIGYCKGTTCTKTATTTPTTTATASTPPPESAPVSLPAAPPTPAPSPPPPSPPPPLTPEQKLESLATEVSTAETELATAEKELAEAQSALGQESDPKKIAEMRTKVTTAQNERDNKEKSYKQKKEKADKEAKEVGKGLTEEKKKELGLAAFNKREDTKKAAATAEKDYNEAVKAATEAKKNADEAEKATSGINTKTGADLDTVGGQLGIARNSADETDDAYRARINSKKNEIVNKKTSTSAAATTTKTTFKEAETKMKKAEQEYEVTSRAVGTEWVGGPILNYAYAFLTSTPHFPALSNAIFKNFEWWQNWRKDVEQTFANFYLGGYFEAKVCDDNFDVQPDPGTGSAIIEISPGIYQFVGSIQAERSPEKKQPLLCLETEGGEEEELQRPCPQNLLCREGLCYKDEDAATPELGYFYKITWAVTAPSDVSFTTRADEARNEIDFNLQLDDKVWLFYPKEGGTANANTNHLGFGSHSRSLELPPLIAEYFPEKFNKVCLVFGDNKPENLRGDDVNKICATFRESALGELQFGAAAAAGGAPETAREGRYCGLDGQC